MTTRSVHWLLREPLLHFLILGIGLFVLYSQFGQTDSASRDRILVDEAELLRLSEQFQRTWMRPPTREELRGLAEDFVKEEVLYREALALGLDRDDLVIRRRMRQKMEFLNADLTEQQPTDADLQAYLEANPGSFRRPPRFSFQQVYLSPQRSGEDPERRAQELLGRLQAAGQAADPDFQGLGDATLLPPRMEHVTPREIANSFGVDFVDAVAQADQGAWSGPHASAYGLHLVRVTGHAPGGLPTLAEARPVVEREWANERRQEADARFYQALRDRYTVEIRLPEASARAGAADDGQLASRP
jgi:hypothetical protein